MEIINPLRPPKRSAKGPPKTVPTAPAIKNMLTRYSGSVIPLNAGK